ncbi:family 78 glycoside hydrolase catalytic domain [Paenibacillus sinopodophylli]|uniref:family 78 glycoside hydrolase catalytic domain n=1 Tax=Paenibacillus sinopodophylli TaxID=1837342 RepID=UPI001486946D|nr:family 78 glycoside hydrolase catalytic domain [Paenibacillus sinopodophylli]
MPSKATYLRCEYLINPLGISTPKPRFSWEIVDERRNVKQAAYQILVASDPAKLRPDLADLWDSGKIDSDDTLHIEYGGSVLSSGDGCFWTVYIWTVVAGGMAEKSEADETAEFSIGLLQSEDWKAEWITALEFIEDSPVCLGYMSLETPNPLEQKWVQIDLGQSRKIDGIRMFAAAGRRGLRPEGGEIPPSDGFPMRYKVEVSENADMLDCTLAVDHSEVDVAFESCVTSAFAETSGRYIRLTSHKQTEAAFAGPTYCLKLAELEVLSNGVNIALGCKVSALDSYENVEEGFGTVFLTDGKTAYDPGSRRNLRPSPFFRNEFKINQPIKRAMIYVTALGLYELYLNGSRVGDHCLAPGFTQYNKRAAVQAFDVTALLNQGANAIGAILADGWYRSRFRLDGYDQYKNFAEGRYGDAVPRIISQLKIEYTDGSQVTIGTCSDWTYTMDGPYRKTSMYDGIHYDSRQEMPGWAEPTFSGASAWKPVEVSPVSWALDKSPQTVQPIRRLTEFPSESVKEIGCNVWLCDFGKTVGGICRVTLQGPAGSRIKLRYIPELKDDGSLYTDSLWGAYNNGDVYILNGRGVQTFEASFTFQGFRYIEVTGLNARDQLVDITAIMIADDYAVASNLQTSDRRLNQLWSNIRSTYQACMKSVLVDVVDRDERWPWLGDCFTTHSQSLPYMLDMSSHFSRRITDMADEQSDEGYFYSTAPRMRLISPSAGWSDAAVTTAWSSYLNYGNKRLLEETYPLLLAYCMLLQNRQESGLEPFEYCWNDHLASHMTVRPGATLWKDTGPPCMDKYHYEMLAFLQISQLVQKIARVVGDQDAADKLEQFAAKLTQEFVGTIVASQEPAVASQTLYGLLLGYGLVKPVDAAVVLKKMLEAIEQYDGFFTTGTSTTNTLLNALSDNGQHELAFHMAMRSESPSFGHMIDHGATAVWERLDSYVAGLGFNPSAMNGFVHSGFGSIAEWMLQSFGGIRPDEYAPSYKRVRIEPKIAGSIDWVEAAYHSVRGTISCEWSKNKEELKLKVEVPANTTATVIIPTFPQQMVTESGVLAGDAVGVTLVSATESATEYLVSSGCYSFHSR